MCAHMLTCVQILPPPGTHAASARLAWPSYIRPDPADPPNATVPCAVGFGGARRHARGDRGDRPSTPRTLSITPHAAVTTSPPLPPPPPTRARTSLAAVRRELCRALWALATRGSLRAAIGGIGRAYRERCQSRHAPMSPHRHRCRHCPHRTARTSLHKARWRWPPPRRTERRRGEPTPKSGALWPRRCAQPRRIGRKNALRPMQATHDLGGRTAAQSRPSRAKTPANPRGGRGGAVQSSTRGRTTRVRCAHQGLGRPTLELGARGWQGAPSVDRGHSCTPRGQESNQFGRTTIVFPCTREIGTRQIPYAVGDDVQNTIELYVHVPSSYKQGCTNATNGRKSA